MAFVHPIVDTDDGYSHITAGSDHSANTERLILRTRDTILDTTVRAFNSSGEETGLKDNWRGTYNRIRLNVDPGETYLH